MQRRFTTKLVGLLIPSVSSYLAWRDKESRRIKPDILFAYRLLLGRTALHPDDFFILSESTCTRGHPYKLFYCVVQLMSASIFFCHRIVKVWNELPIDTDFSSIDSSQRALDAFNFTAYCDI